MKTKMKKGWILLALFCLTLNCANAQEAKHAKPKMTPEQRAEKRSQKLKAELQLSDAQTKQVYEVLVKHIEERDEHKRDKHNMMEKELQRILSPEQMDNFKKLKREERDQSNQHRDQHKVHQEKDDNSPEQK